MGPPFHVDDQGEAPREWVSQRIYRDAVLTRWRLREVPG